MSYLLIDYINEDFEWLFSGIHNSDEFFDEDDEKEDDSDYDEYSRQQDYASPLFIDEDNVTPTRNPFYELTDSEYTTYLRRRRNFENDAEDRDDYEYIQSQYSPEMPLDKEDILEYYKD